MTWSVSHEEMFGHQRVPAKGPRCTICRKLRYQRNREKERGLNVAWKAAHPDRVRVHDRSWRAANADKKRARDRAYAVANRQKRSEYGRRYYSTNRDRVRAEQAAYRIAHPGENQRRCAAWYAANPDKARALNDRRRARKALAGGSYTSNDVAAQRKRQRGRCYWCKVSVGTEYEVDHVIPLSRGGTNGPENIVIACRPCNRKKHCKLPEEFALRLL